MSLCPECGNILVVQSCSPVCLVCQHTGRDKAIERLMEANLNAVFDALSAKAISDHEAGAALEVLNAQRSLAARVRRPIHNRERPDWEAEEREQRDREGVCQTCLGTRRYLTRRCPDCQE